MAGIVHEVENTDLLAQVRQESASSARQLAEAARLHKGQIVVVGCSTSEVVGRRVGSWSTPEVGQAIFDGLHSVFGPMGVYIAAQCCEHLNRALIVEHEAVPQLDIVNVVPQPSYGRYDDGTEFPKGHRQVDRFLNGSFVIFSKQSVYNHISGTYDARHNKMSSMEFRHYIGTMRQSYYMMKDFTKFSSIYQKNPFSIKEEKEDVEIHRRIEESCKFDKFIEGNWNKW